MTSYLHRICKIKLHGMSSTRVYHDVMSRDMSREMMSCHVTGERPEMTLKSEMFIW